mmetsp:Transcript_26890/g.31711  ORF Transcript_26890/g.31711 Transcript_26890/m.31711 type:complete len:1775 (-) Transcript_26890:503-5827(-)
MSPCLSRLYQSMGALLSHLKTSKPAPWANTLLVLLFDSPPTTEEQPVSVSTPMLLSGGFVEHLLDARDIEPFRSKVSLQLTDLHSLILGLSASTSAHARHVYEEEVIEGLDLWKSLLEQSQVDDKNLETPTVAQLTSRRLTEGNSSSYIALSLLYHSTNGANWSQTTNWLVGEPCGSVIWYNVKCSSNQVVYLNSRENNLAGTLPSEMGFLTSLTALALDTNKLTGTLPSELGLLTAIVEDFRPHTNKFTGTFPSEIGQLTLMTVRFYIYENSFTGAIPSQLGNFELFRTRLYMYSNQFSSELPSELGRLTLQFKYFRIYSNALTGSIPSQLGELTAVTKYFELHANSFSGTIPSQLGRLSLLLTDFFLHENYLTGSMPSQLGQLNGLTKNVYFNSNDLCDDVPSELAAVAEAATEWDMTTGNSLGTPCCVTLPNLYTCSPTMLPSSTPTGLPSMLPSISVMPTPTPTPVPTLSPTNQPTPIPSSLPTSLPSSVPTITSPPSSTPTMLPTSLPSLVPTPQPTSTKVPTRNPTLTPSSLPTNSPSLSPTSHPTVPPTTSPTFLPTLVPTPSPTSTPVPSLVPSPQPTSSPTLVPIPLPSLHPSRRPTALPTLNPTHLPTYSPTYLPTPTPTLTPTIHCEAGTVYDGAFCNECPIGYYSNFSSAPYPSNCTLCPSGTYSTETGAAFCVGCASGKLSSSDRTYCKDCEAGEYSTSLECVECESGKYAPQPLSGSCITCPAGSHTDILTKATTCTTCDSGKYSSDVTDTCSDCMVGKFSSSSASSCSDCRAGTVAEHEGASSCTHCSAGTIAVNASASNCTVCELGKYQGATGQSYCEACEVGRYAMYVGSTSCVSCASGSYAWNLSSLSCTGCPNGKLQGSTGQASCDACEVGRYSNTIGRSACSFCKSGKTSKVGSDVCDLAEESYYLISETESDVEACPKSATCLGGIGSPLPKTGYWTDHSDYTYAGVMQRCYRSTCRGGSNTSTCWTVSGYTEDSCVDGQCTEGARGPLCGSCIHGYIHRPSSAECESCSEAGVFLVIVLTIFVSFWSILIVLWFMGELDHFWQLLLPITSCVDTGSLKVIWVTYQIIVSSAITLNIKFPKPFSQMLRFLSVFSLDFLALECIDTGRNPYFDTVYLWCILPLALAGAITLVGCARILFQHSSFDLKQLWQDVQTPRSLFSTSKQQSIVNQHSWLLLLLSYVTLPPVSNKQLQIFDCIVLESGESYVRADTSISCTHKDYHQFKSIIIMFIALYQMIPIVWAVILYRNKHALNPSKSKYDNQLAMFVRDNRPELAYIRFLFIDYTCSKWWFEIAEMYRRIIFIGFLPLISHDPATRASFGLLLAIVSVVYFSQYEPYRVHLTNIIAFVAQVSILVTFYSALTIESVSWVNFGLQGQKLGVFLIFVNIIIIILSFWFSFDNFREKHKEQVALKNKAAQHENAIKFTEGKFKTTFDAIWLHDIPSTDAMVFFYTNSNQANRARRSGLPASSRFNGIPFSLRHPHATTKADFEVFSQVEADSDQLFPEEELLVLSLPRRYLYPLPGYEADDGLCMVSVDVLRAMRPSSFVGVVDSRPWISHLLLLSPHCIIRSYLIMEQNDKKQRKATIDELSGIMEMQDDPIIHESHSERLSDVLAIRSINDYLSEMKQIRIRANVLDLVPCYHFTSASTALFILKHGLRMSTPKGQNEGGVSISAQGPAFYGLGTKDYEVNLIKDFYGIDKIHEFRNKVTLTPSSFMVALLVFSIMSRKAKNTLKCFRNQRSVISRYTILTDITF